MDENLTQAINEARQELAMLQAEIDTLKARKSIVECIREVFSQGQPVSVLKRKVRRNGAEITIAEADFQKLTQQAKSVDWIERKLAELKNIGDHLWHKLNQKEVLKAALRLAEDAEYRCRSLENEIDQLLNPPAQEYALDDDGDREIDYPEMDDREH